MPHGADDRVVGVHFSRVADQGAGATDVAETEKLGLCYDIGLICDGDGMDNSPMTERHAALFRNGRNQAVRIPREFEMEGSEVVIRKEGDRLVLIPIRRKTLRDLLASWEPLDDALPEVEDLPLQPRDAL
jgi:antitoxin VapB